MYMVTAPCIPSAFPFLWEDEAAGVTFSLGKHTLTEMKFLSFFLPFTAFPWSILRVSMETPDHTDISKLQTNSSGLDELLAKGIS